MINMTCNLIRTACLLTLLLSAVCASATSLIPAAEMAGLQKASEKARTAKPGSAEQRRACKRVVRAGNALLATHPDAPNHFQLLGIMLQNQKVVLKLEKSDRNREVLYEICSQLARAPDDWAKARLEADLLLSERELSGKDASLQERAEALESLIKRYRETTAEAKSLMIGAVIAQDLESRQLDRFIEQSMDERCADNPEVIAFRRKVLSLKSLRVKCKGRYQRSDGTYLYIPGDRIGHQCLLVYWSQQSAASERFMKEVKEQQDRFPGAFEVYSFNLDQLPDAGEKVLRAMGLDWQAMHLPDGKRNVAYQAYGAANPVALFVNSFGYTVLNPFGSNPDSFVGVMSLAGGVFKVSEARLSYERYLAQLQSLFIGDFLITDTNGPFDPACPPELKMAEMGAASRLKSLARGASGLQPNNSSPLAPRVRPAEQPSSSPLAPRVRPAGSISAQALDAIQACFITPPLRYRLSTQESLANYQKAEKLCAEALKQHSDASDSWIVRNRRIIALLGMWNLLCDPTYLEQAVQEARTVLAAKLPPEAAVVARFCLAKEALRREVPNPELEIQKMVAESGGDKAPASTLAAAAILALEANRRALHEEYRAKMLALSTATAYPMWGVRSFLLNRYHRFYLLRPNSTRGDGIGGARSYIVNHEWNTNAKPFPEYALKNLDGSTLSLPDDTKGRLKLLLFIEPPADPEADFPVVLDSKGNPTKNDYIRGVEACAVALAEKHIYKEVDVILAFLCDDAKQVKSLMKKNDWNCRAAMVSGGLKSPLVQQLGILSADRCPNVYLLQRDGRVAWNACGLVYKSEFGFPFAFKLAMKVHIELCDIKLAYNALQQKDFSKAARIFAGPFLPFLPDRYGWLSPRYHGKALAQMGLKEWEAALESIDKAIDAHKLRHNRGFRRSKSIEDWREDAAMIPIETPCDIFTELWTTKALILQYLGRTKEAARFRRRAEASSTPDSPSLYTTFHHQLRDFRQEMLKDK